MIRYITVSKKVTDEINNNLNNLSRLYFDLGVADTESKDYWKGHRYQSTIINTPIFCLPWNTNRRPKRKGK